MNSTTKNKSFLPYNKLFKIIFALIIILGIWEISALIIDDSFLLPDIVETAVSLFGIIASRGFLSIVVTSLLRVILGLILGTVFGVVLATLCHYSSLISTLISPIVSIMKATPVACIIVLLWISMNYTGIGVFVVVLMVLPVIWQNALDGYDSISKELSEVADIYELSFFGRVRVLITPALIGYLIPALVTSVGLAWKAEIAAEIMTNSNIGRLIYDYKTVSYDTASIFAWTVIIVSLSIIFEKVTKCFLGRLINDLKA